MKLTQEALQRIINKVNVEDPDGDLDTDAKLIGAIIAEASVFGFCRAEVIALITERDREFDERKEATKMVTGPQIWMYDQKKVEAAKARLAQPKPFYLK